tara:strand:+ start:10642 stop:11136 length:495 start_codon:yes stop_codon:yes gene_type:complete
MKNKLMLLLIFTVALMAFFLGRSTSSITGFSTFDLDDPLSMFNSTSTAPEDRIQTADIRILKDKLVIYVNDTYIANFTNTGSMEPTFSQNSQGIEIKPQSSKDIKVGDIVSYTNPDQETIIHRVIKIGNDPEWFAITKGDNNNINDPQKVRFNQINRILIGILY